MSIEISDEEWDKNKPMYARQYAKKMLSAFGHDSAKRIIEREVTIEQAYKIAKGAITKLDFNDKIKKCININKLLKNDKTFWNRRN